jgi:hypothetical protein
MASVKHDDDVFSMESSLSVFFLLEFAHPNGLMASSRDSKCQIANSVNRLRFYSLLAMSSTSILLVLGYISPFKCIE